MAYADLEQQALQESASIGFSSERVEKALLGSIVEAYEKFAHLADELREEDFFYESHRLILKAIKQAHADGLAVDLVTVNQKMNELSPETNQTALLIECVQETSPWYAESYCRILKSLATRRRAIATLSQITERLKDPANDINGLLEELRVSTGNLTLGKYDWVSIKDVMLNTYAHVEKRTKGEITSITTGVGNLDNIVGGFFGGELTVIGARPAVGKSVFGMNVALAAAKQGFQVGICSREMTDIQYGQRVLSYASQVDGQKIRKAKLDAEDWTKMAGGLANVVNLPVEFVFDVRTVDDLRAEVQRKIYKREIDMLIVDYLQLMETAQRFKEDRLRVGYISVALKGIARDFNIPVIALAQVKRFAGGARAKMPTLEDLKDSGSIEQDADNVIFLHNPYDQEDEFVDPRDKENFQRYAAQGYTYLCIGVAKQRQGVTGKCCVLFDKKKMMYLAIDRTDFNPLP